MIAAIVSALLPVTLCAQSKGGRWQFEMNGDDTVAWDRVGGKRGRNISTQTPVSTHYILGIVVGR